MKRLIQLVKRQAFLFFLLPLTFILIIACPKEEPPPPEKADCPVGQNPCIDDSTECCWDTTSHNFVWEIDTLGISGSLRDVQIIDENNIWVVGEIETDSGKYGGAHWNGTYWVLIKFPGEGYDFTAPIRGLYHFDDNDIWLAAGSIFHWDGTEVTRMWSRNSNTDETVEKIWASSENDVYFVGNEGTIIYYDGTSFTKMTSPTTQDLDGIVGVVDSETGEKRIWVNGWSDYPNGGLLLQLNGTDWEIIWNDDNPFFEDSQYIEPTLHIPDEKYLIVYSGGHDNSILSIHEQDNLNQYEILHYDYNGYIRSLAGNKVNDIIGVGDLTNAIHFNGSTVVQIAELENMVPTFRYNAVDSKGGIVVIVSAVNSYVIRGRKLE